ncbi:hypothetical protein BDR26DRAFT_969990 [Obelidium mucronatum]|nr:hypothetical protein BDR26DRAFT_969990 [Obelidium mucronatum]
MDATVFLTHFNTAFSTYTPFTNQSIWWFAAQSDAIQVSIINSLCAANDTIDVKISTLDIVEQTFDLAKAPESAVQMCLLAYNINDHMKDTVKSQIQLGALNQFLFSPFSPGSRKWIRKQDEDTQVDAIYYICEQYGFTAEQIIQVTDYLFGSGGIHELSTKTLGALTLCASSAYFVLHSDSNTSIQWFGRQNLVIQQRLLVRLCAAKEIPTGNLKHIFGTLRRDASNTTIQLYDFIFDGCIATREYSMADIVKRFAGNLDAMPVHVWVAFQNISQQLNFIDYMYSGISSIGFKGKIRQLTIFLKKRKVAA